MRFPDFVPAKREEVPDYISAAYLQARADNEAAEQERLRKQDRAANIQAVGGGVMNAAQMDLGGGKTPLSMALRYGKEKWGGSGPAPDQGVGGDKMVGRPGAPSRTLGPVPSSASLQSPSYMASPQGQGMDVASALRNPAGDNWQMPGTRPPAPGPAPSGGGAPPTGGGVVPEGVWKPPAGGSPLPAVNKLGTPKAAPSVPVKPPAMLPSGMQIPTGPGPQAATNVPIDKMIGMQMDGIGSNTAANMTAQVGGKGAQSAVATPVAANIASKGATEAVGKGMGGAFVQAGGAAVPGVGAIAGGLPAALRGDAMGAVKGAAGGAASSTLMAAGPAMAAAGPVGWAGMAGLAALSLYGMLG
jgi:hypothetical protein